MVKEAEQKKITAPITAEVAGSLRAGERVLLSGKIIIARDAAHKRMTEALSRGERLPVNLDGATIFYAGPAPTPPGEIIGSIGPTTSGRMDSYTPLLLSLGMKAMIGKGRRSEEVMASIKKYGAVYFGALGGAAVLLSKCVKSVEPAAYDDLGPEAILYLEVEDMPLVVLVDTAGGDLYEEGPAAAREYIS